MSACHNSCLALTVVVMALYLSSCKGQVNSCDINSRPHPQGICGPRLARAHSNLCFLLSQAYPEHFSGKRSVDARSLVDRIYSIPLSVLAEIDVSRENWNALLSKREYHITNNDALVPAQELPTFAAREDFEAIDGSAHPWFQLMRPRVGRAKRVAPQPSMVCECCYNVCTPRHLATYC
jgi:hypothetical protein